MKVKFTLFIVVTVVVFTITSCATKRYPIAAPMSSAETSLMTCQNLELELIRTEQVENKINQTSNFDMKTVLGFLGDFGIGNAMAKNEALSALSERRETIREAQISRGCIKVAPIEQNKSIINK